jgi:hypothetical protein
LGDGEDRTIRMVYSYSFMHLTVNIESIEIKGPAFFDADIAIEIKFA